jgi:hypothetical protein
MQTIVSDVSRVTLLRKRLGQAASSMKVIGLFSAFYVFVHMLPWVWVSLSLGILLLWFAFRLSKHLRLGKTSAVRFITLWVVVYLAWELYKLFYYLPNVLKNGISFYTVIGLAIEFLPIYFVIRGLLDLRAYRSGIASNPGKFEPLMLHPWEERKDVRKHPRFLNKSSLIAYIFVLLVPLPWLVMSSVLPERPSMSDGAELLSYYWVYFPFVIAPTWLLMIHLYRRARRHAMLPENKLLKKDNRDVILYLRAFLDDRTIKMRARANDGRIFPERFVKISFEELVTDHLWRYGPVVAIGDPHTKSELAPLGAVRDFERDDTWQQKVADLMQRASIILAVVSHTEGFLWEIDTVIKLGLRSKLVLLLPPLTAQELTERWYSLVHRATGAEFPQDIVFRHARAVTFPEDQVVVITADKRDDWTYETVLDNAAQLILGREVSGSILSNSNSLS